MRAAVLHEFKRPRSIEEVERPKPNQNEVLIAVEACGVCHSDLHVATLTLTFVACIRIDDDNFPRGTRRAVRPGGSGEGTGMD